jgi:hypothetical protein
VSNSGSQAGLPGAENGLFTSVIEAGAMKRVLLACVAVVAFGGCSHVAQERPEAAGPAMRPGAWRLTQEADTLPWLCVEKPQEVTRLIFAVGGPICVGSFQWRREGKTAWRFESRCAYGDWEQVAEGRAVGDFRTHFAFTARVRGRGFDDPAMNGESIVRVQARYRGRAPCRS